MALDATTLDFVRTQAGNAIAQTDTVLVVSSSGSSYGPWFDQYMGQRGWTSHEVGGVDLFNVTGSLGQFLDTTTLRCAPCPDDSVEGPLNT